MTRASCSGIAARCKMTPRLLTTSKSQIMQTVSSVRSKSLHLAAFGVFALLLVSLSSVAYSQTSSAIGEIIYDNPSGDHPDFFPWSQEYGDELILKSSPTGTPWILSDFICEYFGDFTPQGDEMARIRIYKNDGPGRYASPGTLLFDSGDFPIKKDYQQIAFSGLALEVPNDLTWTVQFSGMRGIKGDQAGLLLASAQAVVGKSFKDFGSKAQMVGFSHKLNLKIPTSHPTR